MDIVIPLLAKDLERYLKLQRPTLERYYADLETTWIVARPSDLAQIREATSPLSGTRVLNECAVVPELPLPWWVAPIIPSASPWRLQQLIKLAMVAQVETNHALVLDADVIAVRPVADSDLVVGGRALRHKEPIHTHPEWIEQSAAALGLDPIDYSASLTTSVLSRQAVRMLAQYVERFAAPRRWQVRALAAMPGMRHAFSSWRGRLIATLPWTEYQLYDTFLVRTGNFDRFHLHSDDPRLYGNGVWRTENFDNWVAGPNREDRTYFFSVIQSTIRVPVETIERKLRVGGVLTQSAEEGSGTPQARPENQTPAPS